MPIIAVLRKLKQGDCYGFLVSVGCRVKISLKKPEEGKKDKE